MKLLLIISLLQVFSIDAVSGIVPRDSIPSIELDEIVVFKEYPFKSEAERLEYIKLEEDIRRIYPLVKIIQTEYARVNAEMQLYDSKRRKEYLKWYENYARKHYMPLLSGLTVPQGRLFLKLINRETGQSSYQLIKTYRNGFRAIFWQGAAFMFRANLKTDYEPNENQMIEHIIQRLKAEETSIENLNFN